MHRLRLWGNVDPDLPSLSRESPSTQSGDSSLRGTGCAARLRLRRGLYPVTGCETAKADLDSNSDGEQGGHWPRMPLKSRSWLDFELVPAFEDLSER